MMPKLANAAQNRTPPPVRMIIMYCIAHRANGVPGFVPLGVSMENVSAPIHVQMAVIYTVHVFLKDVSMANAIVIV